MTRRQLHFAQRDTSVESSHDDRGAQHVRMDVTEPGPFADRAHPAVGGSPVQALPVAAQQDRPLDTLTDGEVDGARGAQRGRDRCGLVVFADDPRGPVSVFEGKALDVGRTGFGDAQWLSKCLPPGRVGLANEALPAAASPWCGSREERAPAGLVRRSSDRAGHTRPDARTPTAPHGHEPRPGTDPRRDCSDICSSPQENKQSPIPGRFAADAGIRPAAARGRAPPGA